MGAKSSVSRFAGFLAERSTMSNQYSIVALRLLAGSTKNSVQTPQMDRALLDERWKMYITRSIPMPQTISQEAQRCLQHPGSRPGANASLAELSAANDAMPVPNSAANRSRYPININSPTIAGRPGPHCHTNSPSPPNSQFLHCSSSRAKF